MIPVNAWAAPGAPAREAVAGWCMWQSAIPAISPGPRWGGPDKAGTAATYYFVGADCRVWNMASHVA